MFKKLQETDIQILKVVFELKQSVNECYAPESRANNFFRMYNKVDTNLACFQ